MSLAALFVIGIAVVFLAACSHSPTALSSGPAASERENDDFEGVEEMPVERKASDAPLLEPSIVAFDAAELSGLAVSALGASEFVPSSELRETLPAWNTERYDALDEDGFRSPRNEPLSTFSIDVDTASYTNVRRFLNEGRLPPAGAVRIEEMLNYFRYAPSDSSARDLRRPLSIETEIFEAPWSDKNQLVRIAVRGREIPEAEVPARNLVFLLDVSGSMQGADRLGLVKRGLSALTERLRSEDHVAIVVYAGASGLVLPPTMGSRRGEILDALEALTAGGSTNGADGIRLAYETARKHFDPRGINRVILATDGDFNLGTTSRSELVRLIERERESGVFLTVLGVGRGNLNDAGMEEIADKGNGHYAYLDSPAEARRVLVEQAGGTLVPIAKDVKIQVEFNPTRVAAYRLVGYENRRLENRDFNDDRKDAGEIGSGHHVTAFYEVVPRGSALDETEVSEVDPLKYQSRAEATDAATGSEDWLTVKLRYKEPDGRESQLVEAVLDGPSRPLERASENGRFSAAVALFAMLLRDSDWSGRGDFERVRDLAREALGEDPQGERAEFLRSVALARDLSVAESRKHSASDRSSATTMPGGPGSWANR